jgi:MFS family permease
VSDAVAHKFDPRYRIVFGACLTQFIIVGMLFAYGLFFAIFEKEFGWPRAVLSGSISLTLLSMGLLAALAGRLSDLYGPRIVLSVSGVLYGCGVAAISQVSEPWHLFLLFSGFIGLGMATHDVVTLSTIARWFARRRGAMTGIVKVSTAIGQICLPALVAVVIGALGWRDGIMAIGFAASALLLLAALTMDLPPEAAAPAQGGPPVAAAPDSVPYSTAVRTRVFWMLCAVQFLCFPILGAVPLHIVAHGADLGLDGAETAGLVSTIGAASIAGRLTVGGMLDRIGGRRAYLLGLTPLALSLLALLAIDTPWPLFAAMAIYGFGHGGLFTVVSPTVAEYFGLASHGALFGTVLFFGAFGAASGPIMTGFIYDRTGSYALAFLILLVLAIIGLALIAAMPRRL